MFNIYYFIKILKEIFGRRKLQRVIILVALFCILMLVFCKLGSFAYEMQGDDTYTDPNSSILLLYDSYLNDLAVRLNSSTSSNTSDLIDRLTNSNSYSMYVMYGTGNIDDTSSYQNLRVVLFNSNQTFNKATAYNQWLGMDCEVYFGVPVLIYDFDNMSCTKTNYNSTLPFYFPLMQLNRFNSSLVEVLANKTNQDTNSVVAAINETNVKLNQTNSRLASLDEDINSTDYDDNEVDVDTSVVDNVDDSVYTGLFTTIFNSFNNAISSDDVEYLNIPIPNTNQTLNIPSNLVSNHLGGLTILVNGFWYFIFGYYAFKFTNNLIVKIKDGAILDGYTSSEVITSDMV